MEMRKTLIPVTSKGKPVDEPAREYIFFTVKYNHFRDVSGYSENAVLDRENMRECQCVLTLPDSYTADGEETPLILFCHGAWGRVCAEENRVGGVRMAARCVDAGYAALDVTGPDEDGVGMGCPEHVFALYKAYRYAIKHYNLSERVLVGGNSMGGQTALNFANTFPGIVIAAGLFCPRLNLEGVTVDGHYCKGTWDKTTSKEDKPSPRELVRKNFRFPGEEWCEENTLGFYPYKNRSFIGADGKRVVIPPCPIKIWQGTEDATVDPVMVREYVESVRRSGSFIELHMLENTGHKTTPVMREELRLWFDRFI